MITHKIKRNRLKFNLTTLLTFISLVTFQNITFADVKFQIAEDYRSKGYAQQQKGNLAEAFSYYNKAIFLGIDDAVLFNDLGVISEKIGFDANAEKYYLKAIKIDKGYLPSYMNLGYFYKKLGSNAKAFKYFKKRYELGGFSDPWAEKAKNELILIRPEFKEWVVFLEAEEFNKELVKKAQEELVIKVKRARGHYKKGRSDFSCGEYQQAIKEYNFALQLLPGDSVIIDALDECVLKMKREESESKARNALKLLESGNFIAAKNKFREVLTTIPNDPF